MYLCANEFSGSTRQILINAAVQRFELSSHKIFAITVVSSIKLSMLPPHVSIPLPEMRQKSCLIIWNLFTLAVINKTVGCNFQWGDEHKTDQMGFSVKMGCQYFNKTISFTKYNGLNRNRSCKTKAKYSMSSLSKTFSKVLMLWAESFQRFYSLILKSALNFMENISWMSLTLGSQFHMNSFMVQMFNTYNEGIAWHSGFGWGESKFRISSKNGL